MRTIVLASCILSLLSYELWRSYSAVRYEAEKTVFNLVHVMSEQVARTIQSIDLNLQDISLELSRNTALSDNDPTFRGGLHKRLATLPYVRALFVIGSDGYISHDTDYPSTPRVNLADRPYFQVHKRNPSIQTQVSGPFKSRSVGAWFISMTRRISAANGKFAGVVVAAVEPLYFEQFYRQMWMEDGTILLLLGNGTMLARSPANEQVMGKSFAAAEPFRSLLQHSSQGVFWDVSPIDGVSRVGGYQRLESVPVVVIMTLDNSSVMKTWRAHATAGIAGATVLLLLLLVIECLSRRSRYREEQARLRLERAQRHEAIGRFAGGIAHDLGNLMRIVRSGISVLRPIVADRSSAIAVLDELDFSLSSGRQMVNELLSYSQTAKAELEPLDLNVLVSELLPILSHAAGPIIKLAVTLADQEALCLVDKSLFQSSLVNLVLNARDAMPSGGKIAIDVFVSERREGSNRPRWIDINVSDDGIGMPDEVRRQAFDPFFTTKGPGSGSGVGLSQVLDFARQSGGRVEIFSTVNSGTTVRLRLPAGIGTVAVAARENDRMGDGDRG